MSEYQPQSRVNVFLNNHHGLFRIFLLHLRLLHPISEFQTTNCLGPAPVSNHSSVELLTSNGEGTGVIYTTWSQPLGGYAIDDYVVSWTLNDVTTENSAAIPHVPGQTNYEYTTSQLTHGAICNVSILTRNQRSISYSPGYILYLGK